MSIDELTAEILRQFDTESESFSFPMFDNGYLYHADQKITIFRDETRWAIVIEVLAFHNHYINLNGITTIARVFGNCLSSFNENDDFFNFASDNGIETFLYDEVNYLAYLNSDAKSIKVKDKEIKIIFDKEHYLSKGIILEFENKITPWAFYVDLLPNIRKIFGLQDKTLKKKYQLTYLFL